MRSSRAPGICRLLRVPAPLLRFSRRACSNRSGRKSAAKAESGSATGGLEPSSEESPPKGFGQRHRESPFRRPTIVCPVSGESSIQRLGVLLAEQGASCRGHFARPISPSATTQNIALARIPFRGGTTPKRSASGARARRRRVAGGSRARGSGRLDACEPPVEKRARSGQGQSLEGAELTRSAGSAAPRPGRLSRSACGLG